VKPRSQFEVALQKSPRLFEDLQYLCLIHRLRFG
jgi:hypothetical protein